MGRTLLDYICGSTSFYTLKLHTHEDILTSSSKAHSLIFFSPPKSFENPDYSYSYLLIFFLPCLQHAEVPGPGIEPTAQL